MIFIVILIAGLCVAYANGANDNFKGVATLFGSGTTNFRRALIWATATTFLGDRYHVSGVSVSVCTCRESDEEF